jgi:hypothetical protein
VNRVHLLVADFSGDFYREVDFPRVVGSEGSAVDAPGEQEERIGDAHSVEGQVGLTLADSPAVERVDEDAQVGGAVAIGIGHDRSRGVALVSDVLDVDHFERLGSRLEDVHHTVVLRRDAQPITGDERSDVAQVHALDPGVAGRDAGLTLLKGEKSSRTDGGDVEGSDRRAGFPAAIAVSSSTSSAIPSRTAVAGGRRGSGAARGSVATSTVAAGATPVVAGWLVGGCVAVVVEPVVADLAVGVGLPRSLTADQAVEGLVALPDPVGLADAHPADAGLSEQVVHGAVVTTTTSAAARGGRIPSAGSGATSGSGVTTCPAASHSSVTTGSTAGSLATSTSRSSGSSISTRTRGSRALATGGSGVATSAGAAGTVVAVRLVDAAIAVVVLAVVADLGAGLRVGADGDLISRGAFDLSVEPTFAAQEGAGVADDVVGVTAALRVREAFRAGGVSRAEAEVIRGQWGIPTAVASSEGDGERDGRPPPLFVFLHDVLLVVPSGRLSERRHRHLDAEVPVEDTSIGFGETGTIHALEGLMLGDGLVEPEEGPAEDPLVTKHRVDRHAPGEGNFGHSLSDEDVAVFGLRERPGPEINHPGAETAAQVREEPVDGTNVQTDVGADVGLGPIDVSIGLLLVGGVDHRNREVVVVDLPSDQEAQWSPLPERDVAFDHGVDAVTSGFILDGGVEAADVAEEDAEMLLIELIDSLFHILDVLVGLVDAIVDGLNAGLRGRSRDDIPADVDPLGLSTISVPDDAHGGLSRAWDDPPGMSSPDVLGAAHRRSGRRDRTDGGAVQGDQRLLPLFHRGQNLATPFADPSPVDRGTRRCGMFDRQVAVGQARAHRRRVVEVRGRGRGAERRGDDEGEDESDAAESLLVHDILRIRVFSTLTICFNLLRLRCRDAPVFIYHLTIC